MKTREKYEFTPRRIVFWFVMLSILVGVACLWINAWLEPFGRTGGTDRRFCIYHQRNLQQAVRAHAAMEGLKPGDPLDWSKIIGPGSDRFIETKPVGPVHGDYLLSPVIPEPGTLAAPCQNPEHRPADTKDW
jgi:hypothetical protein